MRTNLVWTAAGIAALATAAGTAAAGQVFVGGLGDSFELTSNFTNAGLAGAGADPSLIRQVGITGRVGNTLSFGATEADFGNTASTSGNFYLDVASGLGNNWFNTGSGTVRPGANTITLAFGQNAPLSAKDITVNFNPGVQAFGFDFNDNGDQGGTFLVEFSGGNTIAFGDAATINSLGLSDVDYRGDLQSGYVALIANANSFITNVRFLQGNASANDGISVYNFTTLTVVPLPPAAWAGLAMLGGVAGVRRLRRRG